MNARQYAISMTLGVLALVLSIASVVLAQYNQGARTQLAQQQQYLQQSAQLEGLYREMVRALAELSARSGDTSLRALLQRHGIQYSVNPGAAPAAAAAAASTSPVRR